MNQTNNKGQGNVYQLNPSYDCTSTHTWPFSKIKMIIYKATNLINGKVYVGKTVKKLKKRIDNHKTDSFSNSIKCNSAFHSAIRKYGIENFKWEIVDSVLFSESLIGLEKHYIKLFNSKAPNGYNLTDGGEGSCGCSPSEKTREKLRLANRGQKSWGKGFVKS